jgi:hypothetical protein
MIALRERADRVGCMMHRRAFFQAFAAAVAFDAIRRSGALAATPSSLDRWAQDLADLNRDLAAEKVGLLAWQYGIAKLNAGVELSELRRYLDFDRLTAAMTFPTKLAETADPRLPAHIDVSGIARPWFVRFFGLRRGGAIIPHVHNNMVSAHLVVEGRFHARTFDRVEDLPTEKSVRLRPRLDRAITVGETVTMSDDRDNGHWLIADAERAFTFDVGVLTLSKTRGYGLPANQYAMIFVDPTGKPDGAGLIRAPALTFDECVAKFAA